uniref:NADH-ubiquinone oxidoreductase chain 2 n=1 Tax=Thermobia domestica TaxID=89055 RepID=Q6DVL9_THEDO|nr:NADH dehydrogenase subunit 2 [Thermobia domestica]AAT69280.1 NADH dehydrogenase subunit 2 [Thermobia domestica]
MLTNPKTLLFSSTLVLGTLISLTSSSWFGTWIGLEINLLSFIPLISKTNNQRHTESALKYFLVQAIASSLLLMAIILLYMGLQTTYYLITISLLFKMGAAPLHFWMPEVMEAMLWMDCIILMTWQKLAPLGLLSYSLKPTNLIYLTLTLSLLVGSIGGLNQTSLRKIMAFSSINHTGWMLMALLLSDMAWSLYFLFYALLSAMAVTLFAMNKMFHINQTFSNKIVVTTKLAIFTSLLSLGGLPPFLGFLPKWIIIMKTAEQMSFIILTLMVMTALITLFYYMRIAYAAFIINHHNQTWTSLVKKNQETSISSMFIITSLSGMIILPLTVNMF